MLVAVESSKSIHKTITYTTAPSTMVEEVIENEIEFNPKLNEHTIVTISRTAQESLVMSVVVVVGKNLHNNNNHKKNNNDNHYNKSGGNAKHDTRNDGSYGRRGTTRSRRADERPLSPVQYHRAGALDRSRSMSRVPLMYPERLVRESSVSLRRRRVAPYDTASKRHDDDDDDDVYSIASSTSSTHQSTRSNRSIRSFVVSTRNLLRRRKQSRKNNNNNNNFDADDYYEDDFDETTSVASADIPRYVGAKPHRKRRRWGRRLPPTPEVGPF